MGLREEIEQSAELRHEYEQIVGKKEDLERRFNAEPWPKITADRDRYGLKRVELPRRMNVADDYSTSALKARKAGATGEIQQLRAEIATLVKGGYGVQRRAPGTGERQGNLRCSSQKQ
jgi:hypothetical protein